jgi:hypothetical protein
MTDTAGAGLPGDPRFFFVVWAAPRPPPWAGMITLTTTAPITATIRL